MDEWYKTMTVGGVFGKSYIAASYTEAQAKAEADGYEVLDWVDENTLVISD